MGSRKLSLLACFGIAMIAVSCVDPFVFHTDDIVVQYVIYGEISNLPGPYKVTVLMSQDPARNYPEKTADGLSVSIYDDTGFSENLIPAGNGNYYTRNIQGAVGRSYTLKIKTKEGNEYQSTQETMLPVGGFSNLRYEFRKNFPVMNENGNGVESTDQYVEGNGFNVYLDASFAPEQNKMARWKWSGTYEYITTPEGKGYYIGTKIFIPDPDPCAGVLVVHNPANWYLTTLERIAPCTCCSCWHTEYNTKPLISNVNEVVGNETKNIFLGFIPVGLFHFTTRFTMIVQQQSLSPRTYEFWQAVKKSNDNGSDLFQVPPQRTVGNISPITPGAPAVIGLFSAVSTTVDTLRIERPAVPYDPGNHLPINSTCLGFYQKDNTNIKPPWY